MLTRYQRYLQAYRLAEQNESADRDLYYGIANTDPAYNSFLKSGPSIEACAVHDFIKGRFCPPKQKVA